MKKKLWWMLPLAAVLILLLWLAESWFGILPKPRYTAEDFNIQTVKSTVDFDADGIEDYADLLAGAKADAKNRPRYRSAYYQGGYPPENEGVCTDLVWRAFKEAGYSLREMVDADVRERPEAYPHIEKPDANIDFRRVTNLHIFFEHYAKAQTTDIDAIAEWQAGDIVIFGKNKHIGIVSDRRNAKGQPYILHNGGQFQREEDYLPRANVTAHYRFDASVLSEEAIAFKKS